jgi:hypothetical protein
MGEPRRHRRPPRPSAEVHGEDEVGAEGIVASKPEKQNDKATRRLKDKRAFERLTINLPDGPVLGAIKREAERGHLSLSQAGLKALERGVRRAPADVEDRLLQLERSLRDHMRLTARDFALTQELMAGVARLLCERLPPMGSSALDRRIAERDVEALLARVVREVASGKAKARQDAADSEAMPK